VTRALGLFVAYALVVVGLTWPLAARLGTHLQKVHVSSEYDGLFLAWTLAYQTHALTTAPAEIGNGNIFHPARHAVFYGETAFGALPYFAPAFLATGNPVLALNAMTLLSVTLTACVLHLVVRRWTGSDAAGVVAASTLLLTRWVLPGGIPGAPNFAVLQYFPAIVYLASEPVRTRGRVALLALLVVLQGLASVYLAAAVLVPLALLTVWRTLRPGTRADGLRLAVALGLAALVLAPCYLGHAIVARENPALEQQSFFPPFAEEADLPFGPFSYWSATGVPAVAVAVILLGLLVRRRRSATATPRAAWLHGAFWTATGLVIALPPTAHLAGMRFRLPHALLGRAIGAYDLLRVTDRLGVAALMGIAILAGLGFAELSRARRGVLAAVVVGLMFVEFLRGPELPLLGRLRTHTYFASMAGFPAGMRVPASLLIAPALTPLDYPLVEVADRLPDPSIRAVLESPGGPLLELPVGPGAGGSPVLQAHAALRSTIGWRPTLNGYSRYFPAGFPAVMQLARRLPDAQALAALEQATKLDLVLVHLADLEPGERLSWQAFVDQHGRADLRLIAQGPTDALFRVGGRS
jgi:hypothetical protein